MSHKEPIHTLARAVIVDQDHILMAYHPNHKPPLYYLPGGHVEHGEGAQSALMRELIEEMGDKKFVTDRFLGVLEHAFIKNPQSTCCHNHEYNFLFQISSKNLTIAATPQSQEEDLAFAWIPLSELATIILLPEVLVTHLPAWLAQNHPTAFQTSMK